MPAWHTQMDHFVQYLFTYLYVVLEMHMQSDEISYLKFLREEKTWKDLAQWSATLFAVQGHIHCQGHCRQHVQCMFH